MSTKILKTSMLALAGAVALAAAGSASAMVPPYAVCTFKGETELTVGGGAPTTCWLTLTTKVDCAGNIEIVAAGPVAGDASCPGLFLGNFPWTGDAAAILAGVGTIDTGATGSVIVRSAPPSGQPAVIAGGTVTGVSGGPAIPATCDTGTTVDVPAVVQVSGTNNFGSTATFNTVAPDHLQNLGCVF
ncbi:hypothetical protein RYH70_11790 [Alloalcanivorax xenomutans]|uniref:hypothetical protein n=1 Tax=Alloalcanivorax xenomutans TaxID=1094342 RepID=UPI002934DD92|nr:hypothetical protein [Alloalcanivorax xenomutans]WOD26699.1 hypothetical protein RYH70_11790 [Alloalcanivorax xenomutans]